jgi:hypothetical protein
METLVASSINVTVAPGTTAPVESDYITVLLARQQAVPVMVARVESCERPAAAGKKGNLPCSTKPPKSSAPPTNVPSRSMLPVLAQINSLRGSHSSSHRRAARRQDHRIPRPHRQAALEGITDPDEIIAAEKPPSTTSSPKPSPSFAKPAAASSACATSTSR